jgi:hypothetical protein
MFLVCSPCISSRHGLFQRHDVLSLSYSTSMDNDEALSWSTVIEYLISFTLTHAKNNRYNGANDDVHTIIRIRS